MPPFRLWILRPQHPGFGRWKEWYDKAVAFVVCADTEEEARRLASCAHGCENADAWTDHTLSTCKLLTPDEPGIVVRDFRSA
jgi:hypothetical protein